MSQSQTDELPSDASSPAVEPRAGVPGVDAAEVLAVIPARGGSLGVTSKNILPLAGKPVICHTIDHARGSATVTRTVVSTDSEKIAKVARDYGAEVIMRPATAEYFSGRGPCLDPGAGHRAYFYRF